MPVFMAKRGLFLNYELVLRLWFVVYCSLALSLMVCDKYFHLAQRLANFYPIVDVPVASLYRLAHYPIDFLVAVRANLQSSASLRRENMELRNTVLLLEERLQNLEFVRVDNQRFHELHKLSLSFNVKTMIARLLAVNNDLGINKLVLDRGSVDGVYLGQAVIDEGGVVGQVVQVGQNNSEVLGITSNNSGVAVECKRNGVLAVAQGDGSNNYLHVSGVPQTADITIGDLFVSSNLSAKYPRGYPVGVVVALQRDPGLAFSDILLAPSAYFANNRHVLLVWPAGAKQDNLFL